MAKRKTGHIFHDITHVFPHHSNGAYGCFNQKNVNLTLYVTHDVTGNVTFNVTYNVTDNFVFILYYLTFRIYYIIKDLIFTNLKFQQ